MAGSRRNKDPILIRPPQASDRETFLEAIAVSGDLHAPWIHPPSLPAEYDLYLQRYESPENESRLVCLERTGELVGVINLNNIIRGYFENAFLGFYSFPPHAGRGLMQQGLELVLREAFGELGLHRLEANIQPGNERSIRFVQRAGFTKEGYSPRYLRIAGEWRDHERWALLSEDWADMSGTRP